MQMLWGFRAWGMWQAPISPCVNQGTHKDMWLQLVALISYVQKQTGRPFPVDRLTDSGFLPDDR